MDIFVPLFFVTVVIAAGVLLHYKFRNLTAKHTYSHEERPDTPESLMRAVEIYNMYGRNEKAAETLEKIRTQFPDSEEAEKITKAVIQAKTSKQPNPPNSSQTNSNESAMLIAALPILCPTNESGSSGGSGSSTASYDSGSSCSGGGDGGGC